MAIELAGDEQRIVMLDTDDFLSGCTSPVLSESEILDCFQATPVGEGRGGYLVAVGRAIERAVLAKHVSGVQVITSDEVEWAKRTLGVGGRDGT